ncbi:sufurtransferase FdhD [Geobacillus subterraneus]|uniref:Sulfur carrier protein FdhD n=2 Tax=Geobacillus TaxID=129337 RepID=A0ABN4NIL8_9BACL|nr:MULTISPECIES: formate dehydrogenase accessory sulfurtransferase FdhD [Geobacillus]AMX84554.1 sufurtransferase FdhD [Geobacillus subterraneus]KZS24959.1 sulfurtransferase FdhD [Geobacillus subterraneus]OXB87594.1 sulfurtransferase FdhD [Geobacillus uzenensis]
MNGFAAKRRYIAKYRNGQLAEEEDEIALEFPLTVVVNGEEFATIVCTPEHMDELVTGFLASEGVIRVKDDIQAMAIDEKRGFAYVELTASKLPSMEFYAKRFIGSCCGKSRQFYFYNDMKTAKTIVDGISAQADDCLRLMEALHEQSTDFAATGGLHNAALATPDGIVVIRSDIGRHNALDKLYGYCLRHQVAMKDKLIVFSGRVSSEVLLKAAKMGVSILLSKSAPTTLALDLAEELGITVVGFLRGQAFNVYTYESRIIIG